MGLVKVESGIGDAQWDIWRIDLTSVWQGLGLNMDIRPFNQIITNSLHAQSENGEKNGRKGVGAVIEDTVQKKRRERLLSLSGRASFPSFDGSGSSIPIYNQLGYVSVRPWIQKGPRGVIAGFGNRLGVLEIDSVVGSGKVERKTIGGGVGNVGMIRPPPSRRNTGDGLSKKIN